MGAWIWENLQTNFSRNVNLEFLYWIDDFSSIYSFLPVLGLGWFLKQEILSEKLWRTLGGGGLKYTIHGTFLSKYSGTLHMFAFLWIYTWVKAMHFLFWFTIFLGNWKLFYFFRVVGGLGEQNLDFVNKWIWDGLCSENTRFSYKGIQS